MTFWCPKGFSSDDLKPTAKLTEDMYRVLQGEFQQDKVAKQKAEQIELTKGGTSGSKPKRKETKKIFPSRKKKQPK